MTTENDKIEDLEVVDGDEVMGSGALEPRDVHADVRNPGRPWGSEPGEGRGDLGSVTRSAERKVRDIIGPDRP